MRIGIDARMYSQSGIGRYIRNLIDQLQKLDHGDEYFIFLKKEEYESLEFNKNFHKVLANFGWYGVSEQIRMPQLLNKYQLDLVHFPHFNVPILYTGKFVVTIHDLIHQHFGMKRATTHGRLTYKFKQLSYKGVFKSAVARSMFVITPSIYVKTGLMKEWGVSEAKILVTNEAVDNNIINLSKKVGFNKSLEMLERLGVQSPYLFYLGNAHPHKNVEGLIAVFLKLQNKYKQLNLVLSGNDHYFWQKLQTGVVAKGHDENIRFTGYVTDEQVVALYKNAVCFVLPSFEEGFGIPVLESMAAFCPVVSSNAGSLTEVGDDACLYFDPKNPDDMYAKIEQVLNSERLRQDLISKGKKQYPQFSWEGLAKETLEVYKSANLPAV